MCADCTPELLWIIKCTNHFAAYNQTIPIRRRRFPWGPRKTQFAIFPAINNSPARSQIIKMKAHTGRLSWAPPHRFQIGKSQNIHLERFKIRKKKNDFHIFKFSCLNLFCGISEEDPDLMNFIWICLGCSYSNAKYELRMTMWIEKSSGSRYHCKVA